MRHLKSKAEFYELSSKMLLGNRLRQWDWNRFLDLYALGVLPPIIGIRYADGVRRPTTGLYPLNKAYLIGKARAGEGILFDEGAPHHLLTFQGEVMASHRGLELRYSYARVHQRILWLEDNTNGGIVKHAHGLHASMLLKQYLDSTSLETLNEIMSCQNGPESTWCDTNINFTYPIIEFACFSRTLGVLDINTIFWEVRTRY